MKKKGIILELTLCCAFALGAGLTACSDKTAYSGEYHYTNPYGGADYGIKVTVTVQTDKKGDRIRKVHVVDSDYIEASESNATYGWDNSVWYDGLDALLNSYRGEYVSDVLAAYVTTADSGEPSAVSDSDYVTSGATQGSGRLLLAVQNALLSDGTGYSVCDGSYHYSTVYGVYGIKARVVVKDDTIMKVAVLPSSYIEASESNAAYGWDNSVWYDGLDDLLESYVGRTVAEVLAVTVTTSDSVPSAVSDSGYMTSGATQSSGRLLLAIQNALGHV